LAESKDLSEALSIQKETVGFWQPRFRRTGGAEVESRSDFDVDTFKISLQIELTNRYPAL